MRLKLLLLFLFAVPAFAQQSPAPSSTGSITAAGSNCLTTNACINLTLIPNTGGAAVTVSGTWVATLAPEQSADNGTTWTSAGSAITSNGLTTYTTLAMTNFRVRASAYTSGTAVVFINTGATPGSAAGTINGVVVSGTPTVGQVPTATSPTTATWQAGGGGGGSGTVTSIATTSPISGGTITTTGTISCPTCTTTATGTANTIPKYTGAGALANSLLDDGLTTANTLTYAGTGGIASAAGLATTGLHAGYFQCGPGSSDSAAPSLVTFNFQLVCPASITAWQLKVPAAAATGIPHYTNSSNVVTESISGIAIADLTATGTPSGSTFLRGDNTWASAGGGGVTWDAISAPAGNLSLTMGSNTSTFNTTTALAGFFNWKNTTAAVVGTSQGSPKLATCGRAFHGSADVEDCMTLSELPGNGNDAGITFALGHTGTSTGTVTVTIPAGGNTDSIIKPDGTAHIELNSVGGDVRLGYAGTANIVIGTGGPISFVASNGTVGKYQGFTTAGRGLAPELAIVDLTAQSAAKAATTLLATTDNGRYRACFVAKVTTAASTSSVLGGTNGFQLIYTDKDDSVVVTTPAGLFYNSNSTTVGLNTTQAMENGCIVVNAKVSTNIQYQFDYTSVGGTAMQYNLHIVLEAL